MDEKRDYLDDEGQPMTCGDCGRATYYDYGDEAYHHDNEPERGCFLIPAERQTIEQDGIKVEKKADFWWVDVDGKPAYPCATRREAIEIANVLLGGPTTI